MKKRTLLVFTLLSITSVIFGQITSNLGLDSWVNGNGYEEPSNGWSTLNEIKNIVPLGAGPVTVTKTTDKYSGTYAAKLTTGSIIGVGTLIGGVLATGYFDNNALPGQNLKLGVPYTSSPKYFSGYYKYTSVSNDSADLFCALTKWNSATNQRDTLGIAAYRELNTISTYTQFNLKINYIDSITPPDTIIMIFSSSSGAQNFQGQVGSSLFVDEIGLVNSSGVKELFGNQIKVELYPNPTTDMLNIKIFDNSLNLSYIIYNSEGKSVKTNKITKDTSINIRALKSGEYFLSIIDTKGIVASKKFIKN